MLHIFTQDEINDFTNHREGEIKLGQTVTVLNDEDDFFEQLEKNKSKFVIIGIPEDIGVKMNKGNGGAHGAFIPSIKSFLNTQSNQFIDGKDILVLGFIDFLDTVGTFTNDDVELGDILVKNIDKEVSGLINLLVSVGKTPIIIGGGHNNAYGNLKGLATALKTKVNVANIDAHTDLRKLEHRHSGNGFSYAHNDGYLDKYFMFGIHENYTPQYIFDTIHENCDFDYNTFEELAVYHTANFDVELKRCLNFVNTTNFGIEVDLDCIQYFPSSAMTPTGFTPEEVRRFVHYLGKDNNSRYLHVCEGAPSMSNEANANTQVGKFISYIITDFIKSKTLNI